MPVYEYRCPEHGRFEVTKPMSQCGEAETCPQCEQKAERVFSPSAIRMVEKKRLPLGNGVMGKVLTHKETGGLDIFIPSYGAMEQDEVDYIAQGAIEKEQARVKKTKGKVHNETQARIRAYGDLARNTPKGKRAQVLKEAIKETGDRATTNMGVLV